MPPPHIGREKLSSLLSTTAEEERAARECHTMGSSQGSCHREAARCNCDSAMGSRDVKSCARTECLRWGAKTLLALAALCFACGVWNRLADAEPIDVCVVAEHRAGVQQAIDSVVVEQGRPVRLWILANRSNYLDDTLKGVSRLDYKLIPLDYAWAQLKSRARNAQRSTASPLRLQDLAELPMFAKLERLIVLGDSSSYADISQLWRQRPLNVSTVVLTHCEGSDSASALSEVYSRSSAQHVKPTVLLLRNMRARARHATTDGELHTGVTECISSDLNEHEQASPSFRTALSAMFDGLMHAGSSLELPMNMMQKTLLASSAPQPPFVERSPPATPPTGAPHRAAGKRSLLSTSNSAVEARDDDDPLERQQEPSWAEDAREQRFSALMALRKTARNPLPPPIRSVLPPVLPPLPLPLKVLRQNMAGNGVVNAPSLPPPLPLGKQCLPEQQSTCACSGGLCECDLYPDYSPASAPGRRQPENDEEEHEFVPPLRRLQFFNSNFKSGRQHTDAKHSASRSRELKEHRTGPLLRVLCFCRCPSHGESSSL